MFNVSQLYSILQFLRANFKEVNRHERGDRVESQKQQNG